MDVECLGEIGEDDLALFGEEAVVEVVPGDGFLVAVGADEDVLVGFWGGESCVLDEVVEGDAGRVLAGEGAWLGLGEELIDGEGLVVDSDGVGLGLGLGDVEGADAAEEEDAECSDGENDGCFPHMVTVLKIGRGFIRIIQMAVLIERGCEGSIIFFVGGGRVS